MLARMSNWLHAWFIATIRPLAIGIWKLLVLVGLSKRVKRSPGSKSILDAGAVSRAAKRLQAPATASAPEVVAKPVVSAPLPSKTKSVTSNSLFPQSFVVDKMLVTTKGVPVACSTDASFRLVQLTNPADGTVMGWDTIDPYKDMYGADQHQQHQQAPVQQRRVQPTQYQSRDPERNYVVSAQQWNMMYPGHQQQQTQAHPQQMQVTSAPGLIDFNNNANNSLARNSIDEFSLYDSPELNPLDIQVVPLQAQQIRNPYNAVDDFASLLDSTDAKNDQHWFLPDQSNHKQGQTTHWDPAANLSMGPMPVQVPQDGVYPLVHSRANSDSGAVSHQVEAFDLDRDLFPNLFYGEDLSTQQRPHQHNTNGNVLGAQFHQTVSPVPSSASSFHTSHMHYEDISPNSASLEDIASAAGPTLSPPMSSSSNASSPQSPSKMTMRRDISTSTLASTASGMTNGSNRTVTGSFGQFVCPECSASFKIKGYLTRHLKKHAVKKAYNCPFYDAEAKTPCHPTGGFSRRDTYKTHLKARHFLYPTGTRSEQRARTPGVCGGCGLEFASNEDWIVSHVQKRACTGVAHSH